MNTQMEGVFFCMDCQNMMRSGREITEHLQISRHSYFVVSDTHDHNMVCLSCFGRLSSVKEVEKHPCEVDGAVYRVDTLPVKDEDAGFITPPYRMSQGGQPGAPKKRKGDPMEISTDHNDEYDDYDCDSSSDEEEEDQEKDSMYEPLMQKEKKVPQPQPQMDIDSDDSDHIDDISSDLEILTSTRMLKNLRNPRILAVDRESLRKIYIISESQPREKALKRVKKVIAWYDEHKSLSRPLREVTYDIRLRHVCLARKAIPAGCKPSRLRYKATTAARMINILRLVEDLLEHDMVPLRENTLHYIFPDRFEETGLMPKHLGKRLSRAVVEVSLLLKLTHESLRFRPAEKGLIHGEVQLFIAGKDGKEKLLIDGRLGGDSGNNIPSEVDQVIAVEASRNINYVMVVEKDTVFHQLISKGFAAVEECILVCGRGQPDVATRVALRKMKDRFRDKPFYGLVDCNPYGVQIFWTYCFGSEERSHDNLFLNVPELQYLGLFARDVEEKFLRSLTQEEATLSSNIIEKMHKYIPDSKTRRLLEENLTEMKSKGKADLDYLLGTLPELLKMKIKELPKSCPGVQGSDDSKGKKLMCAQRLFE